MTNLISEDEIRATFEELYLNKNKKMAVRNEHGDYVSPPIQDAWSGWLSAYKSRIILE